MTSLETRPTTAAPAGNGAISREMIDSLHEQFEADPAARVAQNAVTKTTIDDIALNRSVVTTMDHTFSHVLDDWKVTNQEKSGRCWMFAALNLFRVGAMKQMNLKEFEFSQNHALFWDKFERANYFLEAIIETADSEVDDRTVAFLLERPLDDGGQWNMFINLIRKHGVAPKSAMPETESSSNTRRMNSLLLRRLRKGAHDLRSVHASNKSNGSLDKAKQEILADIWRILCIHLGTPPREFLWQWNDKDRAFHRDGMMTPQQFAKKYIDLPIDDYVCLVNDPRASSPCGKTFTVQYLGNVVDGEIVTYLNIEIDLMKEIAIRTIENGEPVWFGCDVGQMMQGDLGLWDANLYEYDKLYNVDLNMSKEERLLHHETMMTHAMLFTGVDVEDGTPRRWRVENSWGDERGRKGFYIMNDSWFDQHMFEIAARKSMLPENLQRALDEEPIVLPPWDPMGSLAR